jgi:uroporphyrinogen III methyltransferase/synthase
MSAGAARRGRVVLVGAGPGAPDLITVRGERALREADAVVYDALVSGSLLGLAPAGAERFDVGRRGHSEPARTQDDIDALLIRLAREGKRVVRLKGGDPYVFGRGAEEAQACRAAGVAVEVVPGVSSAIGALSYAGIPVTDRRHAASFAVVTGHKDPGGAREKVHYGELGRAADTLVVLMAMRNLEEILGAVLAGGRAPETPAACVMNGATGAQRSVVATLGTLAARVRAAGLAAPAAVVIGEVVRLAPELAWFERLPLFGKRIAITRQAGQAGEWQRALEAAGAVPLLVPMIRIAPLRDEARLASAFSALGDYDWLVAASANALRELAAAAGERGTSLAKLRARVACVGEASADAARALGLAPEPASGGDARRLLAWLLAQGDWRGQRVLLPRAEGAGEALPDGLRAAGARVDELPLYRTEPARFDRDALIAELRAGRVHALAFASPSAARHFAAGVGSEGLAAARSAAVVAIGPVTAEVLRVAGLAPDVVAHAPSAAGLVAALEAHFSGTRQPACAGCAAARRCAGWSVRRSSRATISCSPSSSSRAPACVSRSGRCRPSSATRSTSSCSSARSSRTSACRR